jgi:amino acid permease
MPASSKVLLSSSLLIFLVFFFFDELSGNLWTCVAHIITAVIGCGVLALSWSVAQLGWVAGPIAMVCFAFVTYISAFLLSHCYRSPGSEKMQRNYSYMDAVRVHLGN